MKNTRFSWTYVSLRNETKRGGNERKEWERKNIEDNMALRRLKGNLLRTSTGACMVTNALRYPASQAQIRASRGSQLFLVTLRRCKNAAVPVRIVSRKKCIKGEGAAMSLCRSYFCAMPVRVRWLRPCLHPGPQTTLGKPVFPPRPKTRSQDLAVFKSSIQHLPLRTI